MSLQVKLAFTGNLAGFAQATHLRIARGARIAAEKQAARAKLLLRQDARAALGDKVANAWRADIYPVSANVRTEAPAVFVFSKAPLIVKAFAADTVIVPKKGAHLAIPTENVPRRSGKAGSHGQGGHLSVKEVEAKYGQKLIILKGRPGERGPAAGGLGLGGPGSQFGTLLGCIDKGFKRRQRRDQRRKSPRGVTRRTDRPFLSVMFVFVRQVGLTKRLNWPAIFVVLGREWPGLFGGEIASALNAGSN